MLRQFAGIQHEIMLIGIGARVASCTRDRWDAYQGQFSGPLIEELPRSAGL